MSESKLRKILCDAKFIKRHLEEALLRREAEAKKQAMFEERDPHAPKSSYRVRCTRLRQAVDHPFLLETCMRDVLERSELEDLISELVKIECLKSKPQKIKQEMAGGNESKSSIYDMAVDIKSHLDDIIASQENDGCLECFSAVDLQSLEVWLYAHRKW
jgi:hypothetical protein